MELVCELMKTVSNSSHEPQTVACYGRQSQYLFYMCNGMSSYKLQVLALHLLVRTRIFAECFDHSAPRIK